MKTFLKRLDCDVPLMTAHTLDFILMAEPNALDVQMAETPFAKSVRAYVAPKLEIISGNIGVVNIEGPLAYRPDPFEMLFYGVEDSAAVTRVISESGANSDVQGVLLDFNTPGGMLLGGPEIGDAIAAVAKVKPVVAFAGGLCCSLGYMAASQANTIVASKSAIVGSIGVISSVTDYTKLLENMGVKFEYFTNAEAKYKGAGAVGKPLTDDQRSQIQGSVDSAFKLFKSTVLSTRPQVKAEAMQGQTYRGDEARAVGLVDAIGSRASAISLLQKQIGKRSA